jgi:adenosylcobinamide-GDP ribazoletransferase
VSRALRALRQSFAYFTIFPVGNGATAVAPESGAIAWLPLTGAAVGAIAGSAGYAAFVWLHAGWAFVVAWAVAIALTGAVHVDGFLDACDGLLVTAPPQRRREIMKDPHHGTYAVVGMAILTAFWLAALAAISPRVYPLVMALTGAASRLAVAPVAWVFPYGTGGSMATTMAGRPHIVAVAVAAIGVEALAWRIAPWALVLAPAAALLAVAIAWWAGRRLGGGAVSGDVYGAVIVTAEVSMLLALAR